MRGNDPVAWANQRKAAIERAKQLREARKSGINDAEGLNFTPQLTKRPSYLAEKSRTDSLDDLAEVISPSNDVFEQPLPGNKAKPMEYEQDLPSPGSDALGKEMKNNGQDRQGSYKSKFLQQHENEAPDSFANNSENSENYNNVGGNLPSKAVENPDEVFMNLLRPDEDSRSNGPGWNDDTSSISYKKELPKAGRRSLLRQKQTPPTTQNNGSGNGNGNSNGNGNGNGNGRRQVAAQNSQKPDWNLNTDLMNTPMAYPPPKDEVTVRQARSSLSLLKSKIRQSESAHSGMLRNDESGKSGRTRHNSDTSSMHSASSHDLRNGMEYFDGRSTAPYKMQSIDPYSTEDHGFEGASDKREDDPFYHTDNNRREKKPARERRRNDSETTEDSNYDSRNSNKPDQYSGHDNDGSFNSGKSGKNTYSSRHKDEQDSSEANTVDKYSTKSDSGKRDMRRQPDQHAQGQGPDARSYRPNPHLRNPNPNDSNPNDWDDGGAHGYQPSPSMASRSAVANSPHREAPQQQQQQRHHPQQNDRFDSDDRFSDSRPRQTQRAPSNRSNKAQREPDGYQSNSYKENLQSTGNDSYGDDRGRGMDGGMSSGMGVGMGGGGDPEEFGAVEQQKQCPDCGRKFNKLPYERHIKICAKVFVEKRKAFDTKSMRVGDNPEQAKMLQQAEKEERMNKKKNKKTGAGVRSNENDAIAAKAAKTAKWKQDSNAFRDAMKAARDVTKAIASGAPLPAATMSAPDPSFQQCPHCSRRFNEKAAERHIPQCANIKAKPARLAKGAGGGGGRNGTLVGKDAGSKRGKF